MQQFCTFVFSLQGYHSTSTGVPPRDPTPDYNMIKASEDNGYTNMEFYRNATTDDDEELDVQHTVRFKSCKFKPPKKKEKYGLQHMPTIQTVRGSVTSRGLFDLVHSLYFVTAALG